MRAWSQVQGWAVRPLVPVPALAAELPLTPCSPSTSSLQGKGLRVSAAARNRILCSVGLEG